MKFSLFYFADDAHVSATDQYRLLLDGARFADERGFAAVWTPERHFHRFGGIYPNPAVTGGALAVITRNVQIRAGSVVVPLHPVLRVAEEWAMVDRMSGGRAGIALAPGGAPGDFALCPENFEHRRRIVVESVDDLRRLWRGESITPDGPRIYPLPVNPSLPLWLAASGSPETWQAAARAGVGVLTHLAGQSPAKLKLRIAEYRAELARAHPGAAGSVVLMLHTFLADDATTAVRAAQDPLLHYLMSAASLFRPPGTPELRPAAARLIARGACDRYLHKGHGLFGTVDDAAKTVRAFAAIGVDEIACLIDFGIPADDVLRCLPLVDQLRARFAD